MFVGQPFKPNKTEVAESVNPDTFPRSLPFDATLVKVKLNWLNNATPNANEQLPIKLQANRVSDI